MSSRTNSLFSQSTLGLYPETGLIDHVELAEEFSISVEGKNLAQKNSGKFYTPEIIASKLINQVLGVAKLNKQNPLKIVDPFCGDGRLIKWMLPHLLKVQQPLEIHIWDYDSDAVSYASKEIRGIASKLNLNISIYPKKIDSFSEFFNGWENIFDIVITNPPWEVVKPNPKDLANVDDAEKKEKYISSLKEFSNRLLRDFPISRPTSSYGGWGVNLSRVGTELSVRLAKQGGVAAIVAPSTIFADQNSFNLRKWLFDSNNFTDINVYPAELKLFTNVDQPSVSFVLVKGDSQSKLNVYNYQNLLNPTLHQIADVGKLLASTGYILPVSLTVNSKQLEILSSFEHFAKLSDLEASHRLWLGRELDETNYQSWITYKGRYIFVKGRDISRFELNSNEQSYINEKALKRDLPNSINFHRIVWRDVSRPSQKRRVIATVIPPGYVTGNSLGVLHIDEGRRGKNLIAMLGILSSFVFEFQLRAYLATAHVSAGVMKRIRIPDWNDGLINRISELAEHRIKGIESAEQNIEVSVAKAYGLNRDQFSEILSVFPKVTPEERERLLNSTYWK